MRYMPHTPNEREEMLAKIGIGSIDDLFTDIPEEARLGGLLDLPLHESEMVVEKNFRKLAAKNLSPYSVPCFLGAGAYQHHVPSVADHIIQRSEFLTSYTPYQPEISQGTLQALFEFQTQVAMLTGMEIANASMYEGATACAEAVMMAGRLTRRHKAVLSGGLHPHYGATVRTTLQFGAIDVVSKDPSLEVGEDLSADLDDQTACVVVQNPDVFGRLHDYSGLAAACHEAGALLVVAVTEVVSLGAVKSPGEMGADIVAAEGQSLGVGLSFGGPYVGLMAAHKKHVRQIPGRLCGEAVDVDGRRSYVLTLSTREQHIRREKATSNICTNSGLCALAFGIHVALLGEVGMRRLAGLNHAAAVDLADRLKKVPGMTVADGAFFNEFTVTLPGPAADVVQTLADRDILAGVPASRLFPDRDELANVLLVAATETNTSDEMDALVAGLTEVLS